MRRIGFYGGTFDPIHVGHLNLALEILEKKKLDQVWFCPAFQSPHKLNVSITPSCHRLEMVRLALAPLPCFKVMDLEIKRARPSYTIETLRELSSLEKESQLFLIMGDDALGGFPRWHQVEEIVKLVPLLIGCRSLAPDLTFLEDKPGLRDAILSGLVRTRIMEISATEIRARLELGLYCGHFLPHEVLDYIKHFRLYFGA